MSDTFHLGIDLGSITVKTVLTTPDGRLLFAKYRRHGAAARQTLLDMLAELDKSFPGILLQGAITGSASLGLPQVLGLPFVQEVIASSRILNKLAPRTDVAIELGGEDAKILYFGRSIDLRMNEACAGGTGAFIDQMASLLHTDTAGLDALASKAKTIHPIASRCGVFAKTDLVSLLNEGVSREDLAISVLQAVVEQTISGLACGQPIRGNVAFLGGPLHFLPQLVQRFINTLHLQAEQAITFPDGQYMVALGAALSVSEKSPPISVALLCNRLKNHHDTDEKKESLPRLFKNEADYAAFRARHNSDTIPQKDLKSASGELFLGLDLGSTTVKSVLIDSSGAVLDQSYNRNDGDPLKTLIPYLIGLLSRIPPSAKLRAVGTTGYGAALGKAALNASLSEVETVAHLTAACTLQPLTTYVIDIGGQDMKCMKVDDGAVADVKINEACSSGCGAFLQTFATSLGMSMPAFVQAALTAPNPVDLGSRCTVFMNSKVKQAQKEGAHVADIAAGLCYSVVRNALYKVLRLRSPEELGHNILVQGGSFLNDALLRVLENMLGRPVHRPNLSGHMGAYGMALLCLQRADSLPPCDLTQQQLCTLTARTKAIRCKGCGNHCHLTINTFSNGQRLVSGNRCDRVSGIDRGNGHEMPNIYEWKEKHLFAYTPLSVDRAPRGRLGIPRVLNIYERYPFWFTLFTALGFRVELSPVSDKQIYSLGISSMPSQTVCYPAKLAHGHIAWLLQQGINKIFFPCISRERREYTKAEDSYSCPVACGYPEVLRLNTEEFQTGKCTLFAPYLRPDDDNSLVNDLAACFTLPKHEIRNAVQLAHKEQDTYTTSLRVEGKRILDLLESKGGTGVVLCGRPYHADPLVHHGIPALINALGAAVLSEDSIAWLAEDKDLALRVVDQWAFPSRLYRAARIVSERENLELVQLTSFGCGVDAITTDQVAELLHAKKRMYTLLKIDEGLSLGAARIRIRSLLATVAERRRRLHEHMKNVSDNKSLILPPPFTRSMRHTHTIVVPQMAPLHFTLAESIFRGAGYNFQVLPKVSNEDIETGLRFVNNDACYPAQVVIGQLITALKNNSIDAQHSALLLSQTCGPCRATNYPGLLTRALREAGFTNVPVLTIRSHAGTYQPGFTLSHSLLSELLIAVLYADMLQRVSQHTLTYELNHGDTDTILESWLSRLKKNFEAGKKRNFSEDMAAIVHDFGTIPMQKEKRPRVGIVGEILLCYHPDANRHIANATRLEGGEPVLADLMDFFLYCFSDPIYQWQRLGGKVLPALLGWYAINKLDRLRNAMRRALAGTRFPQLAKFKELSGYAGRLISPGFQAGEGWLLSAELLKFIAAGTTNALCLQPFGCLPNHIAGRGVFKELKRMCTDANLMAIDYEAGNSEANLLNRLKLFMSMAKQTGHDYF